MSDLGDLEDLVAYLVRTTRLSQTEVNRLVNEVMAFMDETSEEFVRRRHQQLQREGLANSEIFSRLVAETKQRRFCAPDYTERQIRRIIYG